MRAEKFFAFLGFLIVLCRAEEDSYKKCGSEECDFNEISPRIQNLEKEGSDYLQTVMRQLEQDKFQSEIAKVPDPSDLLHTHRIAQNEFGEADYRFVAPGYDLSGSKPPEEVGVWSKVPPLLLTKEELSALYDEAVAKAAQLELFNNEADPGKNALLWDTQNVPVEPSQVGQMEGPLSGYYYYYFPLKSFAGQENKPDLKVPESPGGEKSPHQVLATVTMIDSTKKSVEPLFVAVSSFIGMALFFLFSIIFMPGFHKTSSKNIRPEEEMKHLGQILLQAMAGGDCSERFACEFVRIFRGLKSNNKTLRVLEIILPPNLAKKISYIRKAAGKRGNCGYISCRTNEENSTGIKTYKAKPWKSKETAHDLWMKHFEKDEIPLKQWQKNSPKRQAPCRKT